MSDSEIEPGEIPVIRCPECDGEEGSFCVICFGSGYIMLPGDVADEMSRERGGKGLSREAQHAANVHILRHGKGIQGLDHVDKRDAEGYEMPHEKRRRRSG